MHGISSQLARYVLAILASLVALFLRYLLTPLLGTQNPYHTVWLAVVFSAWYCGVGPSIVASLISALGVWYWFVPSSPIAVDNRETLFGAAGFLLFSAVIIALGESNRRGSTSRYRLAAIIDSTDDAIVSKSLEGIIESWNRGAERIFEWTAGEIIGKPILTIIPPDLQQEELEILERLRAGQRVSNFETVRVTKTGKKVHVSLTISPISDSRGKIIGASKIARDITERKKVEQELQDAHDQLEERVRERTAELLKKNEELLKQTDIVRGLSGRLLQLQDNERRRIARELHDGVGQTLAALSMNIAMVSKEKENLSPRAAQCVEENARFVEQISQEIRTISHLLHPPMLDEIGLKSAIRDYVDGFSNRSKIEVALDLPADMERLSQDLETSLFRVVQESLTNIHRHSGSATAAIRLALEDGNLHLEVADHGNGIPEEQQRALNLDGSYGVGLRGMRERVRQFGGTLQVHSNGNGTIVRVTLPLTHSQAAAAES